MTAASAASDSSTTAPHTAVTRSDTPRRHGRGAVGSTIGAAIGGTRSAGGSGMTQRIGAEMGQGSGHGFRRRVHRDGDRLCGAVVGNVVQLQPLRRPRGRQRKGDRHPAERLQRLSVSCFELGKKAIRPENLVNLCRVLEVSPNYLLTGAREPETLTPLERELSQLPKDEYALVESLVHCLHRKTTGSSR